MQNTLKFAVEIELLVAQHARMSITPTKKSGATSPEFRDLKRAFAIVNERKSVAQHDQNAGSTCSGMVAQHDPESPNTI